MMKRSLPLMLSLILLGTTASTAVHAAPADGTDRHSPAPAFTHTARRDWLNSDPLTWADLRGRVVLLDFWTFMCWNCYRSFPWLTGLEEALSDRPFTVIGVHTPEFEAEKDRARIQERADHFGLHHPIMIDNDHSYWQAMNNRYWPAYYLIDKQGRLRALYIGETHAGSAQARKIRHRIERLLDEPAPE
ncbi:MAG: redoxin family protein [Salinisphaeraceae bacterium]